MKATDRFGFPRGQELTALLNLEHDPDLEELFARSLLEPVDKLFVRPGKSIRAQLVNFGFKIGVGHSTSISASERLDALSQACDILELLHAGSLVVDDIEDGSTHRRGAPSIHTIYGVPVALNAGNWLYFLPFKKIDELNLPEHVRTRLVRECHRMLLLAHYGQALDVGVTSDSVDQSRVPKVAMAAMELKSGVLTGFAIKCGALIAEAPDEVINRVELFGRKLGVALQMFDDIGNLSSSHNPQKRAEDLKLKRPNFVSMIAAQTLPSNDYRIFMEMIESLPGNVESVLSFLKVRGVLTGARDHARGFLDEAIANLSGDIHIKNEELLVLEEIKRLLESSYE